MLSEKNKNWFKDSLGPFCFYFYADALELY